MKASRLVVFWNPFETKTIYSGRTLFLDERAGEEGVILVDLHHFRDERTRKFLRDADLAVIFLKQDMDLLDSYFGFETLRHGRVLYCVYDYSDALRPDRNQIIRRYRVSPGRLCVLPYNSRLCYAGGQKILSCGFGGNGRRLPYEQEPGYYPGLREARAMVLGQTG